MNKLNVTKEELIEDYKNLKCLTKIALKYNVHRQTIANKFNILSIPYKSKTHRFSSNENYFNIDSSEVFYWAGFLAADGCLYKRKDGFKQLILKLAEKDLNHLKLFKECISSDAPISLYNNKNSLRNKKWNDSVQYQFRLASRQIFNSLEKFNIVPKKTKIYQFPEWIIKHDLVNHFLRGYFDGDGCISQSTNWSWSMRGNIDFLTIVKNILETNCNLQSKSLPKLNNGTGELRFTGRIMISKIVDYLYKDATIFLQRKYDIAIKSKNDNFR